MAAKKRTSPQIPKRYPPFFLARQIAALKKISESTDTPVQSLIREAVEEYLERRKTPKRRRARRTGLS